MPEALSRHPLRPITIIFAVVISVLGIYLFLRPNVRSATPDFDIFPVQGLDLSAHNGFIDFDSVKAAGFDFVILKATEGGNWGDKAFDQNYQKARNAGLMVGAYHYFRFDRPGAPQAINVYNTLWNKPIDLPLAVDVEDTGNARGVKNEIIRDRLKEFVRFLENRGVNIMFYTNKKGFHDYLRGDFENYPLWICSFSNSTQSDNDWLFWQYSHSGEVDGVDGAVDMNVFNGSKQKFKSLIETQQWKK